MTSPRISISDTFGETVKSQLQVSGVLFTCTVQNFLHTDSYQNISNYHVRRASSNEWRRMSVFLSISRVFYANVLQYQDELLTPNIDKVMAVSFF